MADILQAAAQVLAHEGAQRFTTARVAEKAGVSVGSLYQYFPNKASILFRLQTEEWRSTTALLRRILEDRTKPPLERLRAAVHASLGMRGSRDAPSARRRRAFLLRCAEAREPRGAGTRTVQLFIAEALPQALEATRGLAGDVIMMTLSAVGEHISETPRTSAAIETYANAVADILCAYLERLRP